jgi:molecular chaperone DnaK
LRADAPEESAMQKVKDAIKTDNADSIKSAIEQLEQASHAFSKTLYESAGAAGAADGPGATSGATGGPTDGKKPGEEEAIDAEFEVKE